MAETIHDLAVVYSKKHQGTVIEAFEAGANTVVSRIKRLIRSDVIIPISDREANHILDMICNVLYNLRKE